MNNKMIQIDASMVGTFVYCDSYVDYLYAQLADLQVQLRSVQCCGESIAKATVRLRDERDLLDQKLEAVESVLSDHHKGVLSDLAALVAIRAFVIPQQAPTVVEVAHGKALKEQT